VKLKTKNKGASYEPAMCAASRCATEPALIVVGIVRDGQVYPAACEMLDAKREPVPLCDRHWHERCEEVAP
jgi:hypothetical protein